MTTTTPIVGAGPGALDAGTRPRAATTRHVLSIAPERLLHDWKRAHARAMAYMDALGVPPGERGALATEAVERALTSDQWSSASDAVAETLHVLRDMVAERFPAPGPPTEVLGDRFLAWRLHGPLVDRGAPHHASLLPLADALPSSTPPIERRSMVPEFLERRALRRIVGRLRGEPPTARDASHLRHVRRRLSWTRVAHRRRLLLSFLVLIPSVVASAFMVNVLPHQGGTWLELAIVLFFGALFGWISIGFWTALLGFLLLIARRDRFAITHLENEEGAEPTAIAPEARTAIIMPICEEPIDRVFAGLRAIHRSLERANALEHFHFFVLSDSGSPSTWVREEEAWSAWCRETAGFGRIFYRRRRVRLRRKSGNVADFCRRWGARYRYMVTLDADSVMSGEALVRLVRLMERNPGVGMIQTAPVAVHRRSLLARAQQFAGRIYGPMFAAGLHFWQLGDGQYWGHNTIIRIAPFMAHCALPRLPGRPPLGGEILSHDFVEAALMGRAGWTLWLAYDLEGSYEEVPSTLLEEMKRDRRWCQGNLQHLRLLFTEGLFGAHRALFINGVLSYVTALLWFAFLTLSTAEAIVNALREPEYFPHGASLFPEWPVWRPDWALTLLGVTGMILFLPKVLGVLLILFRFKGRDPAAFGGPARLALSVMLEVVLSSLLAPIRMVFHSRFVVQNLLGRNVVWRSQTREDAETGWGEAIRHHGLDTLVASAWGATLFWLNPDYFWWITPIIGALILSIPLSVWASRVSLGERARELGLFLIPEESRPPVELRDLAELLEEAQARAQRLPDAEQNGFVRAVVDPYVAAVHRGLLRGSRTLAASLSAARSRLVQRMLADGPTALGSWERKVLLSDPDAYAALHQGVWEFGSREEALRWGRPGMRNSPDSA